MKSAVLWTLIAINALLLVSFLNRIGRENTAIAQPAQPGGGGAPRRPGDYLMVPGEVTGGSNGIVYVVDTTNAKLGAMTYDENAKRIVSMRSVDLTAVFQLQRTPPPAPRQNR